MIIVANKSGQMCNQIIEFMHPYAMALEYGHTVIDLFPKDYWEYFTCMPDMQVKYKNYECKLIRFLLHVRAYLFSRLHITKTMVRQNQTEMMKAIRNGKVCILRDSFIRDFDALEKQRSKVEQYFTFKPEITKKVNQELSDIRKELDPNDVRIVGVHLRRKDYRVYANGQYYFDDETVAKWLKSLESEHRCHFLIFSDEEVTATNFTRGG